MTPSRERTSSAESIHSLLRDQNLVTITASATGRRYRGGISRVALLATSKDMDSPLCAWGGSGQRRIRPRRGNIGTSCGPELPLGKRIVAEKCSAGFGRCRARAVRPSASSTLTKRGEISGCCTRPIATIDRIPRTRTKNIRLDECAPAQSATYRPRDSHHQGRL